MPACRAQSGALAIEWFTTQARVYWANMNTGTTLPSHHMTDIISAATEEGWWNGG